MTTIEISINILAIFVALLALFFSWFSYSKTKEHEKMRIVDDKLSEILAMNLQYPDFDDPNLTANYENLPKKKIAKQYDIFAMIVWNYLELLYNYYGERKLKKTDFWGVFEYWTNLHYHWFSDPEHTSSYSQNFINFVLKLHSQEPISSSSKKAG